MSRRIAVFDLDGTLLHGDTDEYWLQFLIDEGVVDHGAVEAQNCDIQARYAQGCASAEEFCFFYVGLLRGRTRRELEPLYTQFMREIILPNLPRAALALVADESQRAELLVMSTATSSFLSAPIGRHLGFEHIVATEPEVDDQGRFTGGCIGLPNMRAHKVARLDDWLAARGRRIADFHESWFYTDSRNDLPLLEHVTHPIAVDPDPELAARAQRDGWPVLRIHPPATPHAVRPATPGAAVGATSGSETNAIASTTARAAVAD